MPQASDTLNDSIHRRRRHRTGHLARERARVRRRRREARTAARARSSGSKCSPARKRFSATGNWLPDETLAAFRQYLVGIKGPLTTPVGGGIRSLNVALRQELDLYVCLRPVRYFKGMETPVKRPDLVDMVIFRENTEDIYAGIEFRDGTPEVAQFKKLFAAAFPKLYKKIRFPDISGIGIKPISREGSERLIRAAIEYAIANQPQEPHARAQGQHHEVHRGRLPRLGLRAGEARVRRRRVRRRARGASCRTAW